LSQAFWLTFNFAYPSVSGTFFASTVMVLMFLMLWIGLEGAHASGAIPELDKVGSECMLATKTVERQAADVLEESENEPLPSFLVDRNVYIVSAGSPSEYLSVLEPDKQGDPGVFQKCGSSNSMSGCKWQIKPTADGEYYLKTSSSDQTLHWTHGGQGDKARGEAATLYPCMPPTPDYSNCKWRFVAVQSGQNEYLIQAAGEDNYLIAPAPADGKTMATVDAKSACNPDTKCVWKLGFDTTPVQPKHLESPNKLYIESTSSPGEYLSVLRLDKQGDPGVFQKCATSNSMTGCLWEIKPTADGQYYLKPTDSEMTLHWTWGAAGDKSLGEAATLYPCLTENSDSPNCKWTFIRLHGDEYLLKAFGEEAYLLAYGPDKGETMVTADTCNSFSPDPKCVWKVTVQNSA